MGCFHLAGRLGIATLVAASLASSSGIDGPSLGLLFDPHSDSLRPIQGIIGAARVDAPLPLDARLLSVQVAPHHEYALAVDTSGQLLRIASGTSGPSTQRLGEGIGAHSAILISPTGAAGAVYDPASGRAELWKNLLAEPVAAGWADLEGLGAITALAVSDDAGAILAATGQPDRGRALYLALPGRREIRRLGAVEEVASIVLVAGDDAAVVADRGRNEIVLYTDLTRSVNALTLATAVEGVDDPHSVAFDVDRRVAIVAMSSGSHLALIPIGGGAIQWVDCRCRPDSVAPLRGESLYRLTSDPRDPIFVLDIASAPRIGFIPAIVDEMPAGPE